MIARMPFAALCLAALLTMGCATAQGTYGTRARFSPAFQGYVMAVDNGSDDPGANDWVLVLRDPLSGNKLRCHEDVVAWRELHEDLAVDLVRDHNAETAALVAAGAVYGPLLVVHPVGAVIMAEALLAQARLYDNLRSANAKQLLARGIVFFRRERYPQAVSAIEHALAKDAAVGIFDKAFFYLGLAYLEENNPGRARLALSMFMDRAAVRDVDAYRTAEAALATLAVTRAPCGSTEPIELRW
jgi:tetratricopeptide (TPR) repeat protein